jgi:hypothetical protein
MTLVIQLSMSANGRRRLHEVTGTPTQKLGMVTIGSVAVQSALFVETTAELFARVFRELKPRTPVPSVRVEFCQFANANSFIRIENGALEIRLSDVLDHAPAQVIEALAHILISKLYRKPIPRAHNHRYRLYLNRKDVRQKLHQIRRQRGRKLMSDPAGQFYDLEEIFENINVQYFGGMMSRPDLGWSLRPSRTTLGHYDPSHHAIILSKRRCN